MSRSLKIAAAGAVAAALTLAGCGQQDAGGGSSSSGTDDGGKPVVGLVMKSLGNPYFQDMQKGAVAHAKELGNIELKTVGTQSETDVAGQVDAVNNLVAQGVDAIVIAPADSQALVAPLVQADAAGVKIVNIDVKLDDDALADAGLDIPFVGPDNVEGAHQVGEVLAKDLGEGGKVIVLEGVPSAANAQQRKDGFLKAIKDGGLNLVASRTANWETDEANTVTTNLLSANEDVEGIMASNDSMALGALSALESAGRDDVAVVGFDNIPEVKPYLDDGRLLATLDQYGSQQAAFGIDAALKLLDGDSVPDWDKTAIKLITGNQ
jgi:ribose transport system substrate-binding protein